VNWIEGEQFNSELNRNHDDKMGQTLLRWPVVFLLRGKTSD
jgi:hypothetical protein